MLDERQSRVAHVGAARLPQTLGTIGPTSPQMPLMPRQSLPPSSFYALLPSPVRMFCKHCADVAFASLKPSFHSGAH